MKSVKVMYTTKAEYAAQNQTNIQAVMSDLQAMNTTSLFYHVCLGADGKTFIHTAFFKTEEDQKLLFDMASFKSFQEQLRASMPEVPPQQEILTFVGASKSIF